MKALLCSIPLDIGQPRNTGELPIVPKIAIVSLIKWMEHNGYTRNEYDFYDIDMLDPSDQEIRDFLRSYAPGEEPTVVGLSATVSTTYTQVKRISGIIREILPNAWIVQGGSLSASANVVLRKTEVDICVQSDGENPWVEFLNYVKKHDRKWDFDELRKIKGLSFIVPTPDGDEMEFTGYPEKIPASENPYPDYEILAIGLRTRPEAFNNYFRQGRGTSWFKPDPRSEEPNRRPMVGSLWTTKGCVARCTFCQRSTKGYTTNNVTTLDEHLEILKTKYNVGFIHILDENFASDKKHARSVAETLKKHDMIWIASGVRCISMQKKEDVEYLRDNNCSALKFGVESGSQKILDLMEKRFTVQEVYTAIRHCYELGLYSPLAVMTGMPGETDQTAMETGVYLGKLARMIGTPPGELGIAIFYALPLPGTPLYQYGQQTKMIGRSVEDEERYLIAISDRGSEKENFINLNGSSMREILFWEFLIRYEATRIFYEKPLGEDCVKHGLKVSMERGAMPTDIHGVQQHSDEAREMNKLYPSLGSLTNSSIQATRLISHKLVKFLNPKFLAWWLHYKTSNAITLLNYRLVFSPTVSKAPRWLVYGVMKNLLFAEYLYRRALRTLFRALGLSVKDRNLFNDFKLPKPITDDDLNRFQNRIDRSLRHIVSLEREKKFQPRNLSETNQELLNMGR